MTGEGLIPRPPRGSCRARRGGYIARRADGVRRGLGGRWKLRSSRHPDRHLDRLAHGLPVAEAEEPAVLHDAFERVFERDRDGRFPRVADDPEDPSNRRIVILVLKKEVEEALKGTSLVTRTQQQILEAEGVSVEDATPAGPGKD